MIAFAIFFNFCMLWRVDWRRADSAAQRVLFFQFLTFTCMLLICAKNITSWVFQRLQIALVLRTRNHTITYTNIAILKLPLDTKKQCCEDENSNACASNDGQSCMALRCLRTKISLPLHLNLIVTNFHCGSCRIWCHLMDLAARFLPPIEMNQINNQCCKSISIL
jgi:hypothetical protein